MKKKIGCSLVLSLAMIISAQSYSQDTKEASIPQSQEALTSLGGPSGSTIAVKANETSNLSVARAPAAPLTQMWVYAVGSSNCGWENTAGLSVTTCNHGGLQLRTAVLEIGYGSSRIAWMIGGLLGSPYATTPVCITGGYYSWPCTAGQSIVGFLVEYNLDGNQSGLFKYQNTSTNSPWNTMSVQINIL